MYKIVLFSIVTVISIKTLFGFPGGSPSCYIPYPIGHSGDYPSSNASIENSLTYQHVDLPVVIKVMESECKRGKFRIEISMRPGNKIHGFMIRNHLPNGDIDSNPGTWSTRSNPEHVKMLDICLTQTKMFYEATKDGERPVLHFALTIPSGKSDPIFNIFLVKETTEWWHNIIVKKMDGGAFQTMIGM